MTTSPVLVVASLSSCARGEPISRAAGATVIVCTGAAVKSGFTYTVPANGIVVLTLETR